MLKLDTARGEYLFLVRRRAGETQVEFAKRRGQCRSAYLVDETCNTLEPHNIIPAMSVDDHEWCTIMRRRSGLTQKTVAEEMGVCRHWVRLMEQGKAPSKALVEFWRGNE